ncbi:MAG TPA: aldo/keto reductase [Sediminibacterium sp.]|nr:aldo/keto reductase [Sediminibacterium sp.]
MEIRKLGSQGLTASQLGLGCMGMSEFYGAGDDAESLRVLDRSLELGINFWDTADIYGPFTNEILVGKALQGKRDRITLATKFGIVRDPNDPQKRGFNGKPDYVYASCEASLKRLNTDVIDLYYLHRVDKETPIEETVGAMGELVKQGKVRAIGLSEVSAATLRKAHAVFPITAVQTEYSLWTRDPEEGVLAACRELDIAFVAYSPLGRGFLTGQIRRYEDFAPDDFRRFSPRFQGENFDKNLALVEQIARMAAEKNCTPSQLALAWVMHQGQDIFPIPGTKRLKYLDENAAAVQVTLSSEELVMINAIFPPDIAAGTRYPAQVMAWLNQ